VSDNKKLLQTIRTADDFRACAYALESEAAERYAELADQMEVHNNREVAALFRKMAEIEGKHIDLVLAGRPRPAIASSMAFWLGRDGAETIATEDLHYLMTPHHALTLALKGEQNAAAMFETLAAQAPDPTVRRLAAEMAAEEREHIELIKVWLAKFPEPDADWHDDPDPPVFSE